MQPDLPSYAPVLIKINKRKQISGQHVIGFASWLGNPLIHCKYEIFLLQNLSLTSLSAIIF